MSASAIQSAKLTGSTGTTSTTTITAPAAGNTLIVSVTIPIASAPVTPATALIDNATPPNVYDLDRTSSWLYGSQRCYFYRKSNIQNLPTSISFTGSASLTAIFELVEFSGMDNASPYVGSIADADLSGGVAATTHTSSFATTNPNDIALLMVGTVTNRLLSSASNGFVVVLPESVTSGVHMAYLSDAGAAGSKSTLITLSGSSTVKSFGAIYKSGKPIVTTTGNTVTEGTALRFTLTMASDPGATTDYSYSWGGTAFNGADYDDVLTNATFSAGLSFTGGNIRFASGTTSGTIDVTTYNNALDQADRTLILTVGGTASTGGTITDDDASPALLIPGPVTVDSGDSAVASYTLGAVSGRVTYARLVLTDGTAVGGTNYTNTFPAATLSNGVTINAGVLSIPAGVAGFTITIPTT